VLHRIAFAVVSEWCQEVVDYTSPVHSQEFRSRVIVGSPDAEAGMRIGYQQPRAFSLTASTTSTTLAVSKFINVEPRGVEPLTSAVQSQIHIVVVVPVVQKLLQVSIFFLAGYRECSPLFAWVGVLLV
jgi:hypothetical protein